MNRRRIPHIGWFLLAIPPLLLVAVIGPLVLRYYRARNLDARVEAAGGRVEFVTTVPPWLLELAREYAPERWSRFLCTTPFQVDLTKAKIDDDFLKVLDLTDTRVAEETVDRACELKDLRYLGLLGTRVSGAGYTGLIDASDLLLTLRDFEYRLRQVPQNDN